jgi:uncharacterized protein (PEP-CTERM system associated)
MHSFKTRSTRRRISGLVAGASFMATCLAVGGAHAQDISSPGGASPGASTSGTNAATPVAPVSNAPQSYSGIGTSSGLLPSAGFGNTSLSNIRDFIATPLTAGSTRTFTFQSSVDVEAGYNDNPSGLVSSNHPKGSFETRVTPSLAIIGQSRRLQVNLLYDPTAYYYPSATSQSRIDQNLNAGALAELVPETAFLDLHAFATQTSNSGINGPYTGTTLSRQDQTQVYSVSANPYVTHTFGGTGTVKVSYSIANTITQSSQGSSLNSIYGGGNTRDLTQTEDANFTTGDDFGRFNHTADISSTQYGGSGSLRSGHRNLATYDIAYAVNRFLTVTARAGYEDLLYNGTSYNGVITSLPYKLNEPVGSVGFRVTPNADSHINASYGHIDGGQSFTLDASYKPTARTVVYATSSSGLTTNAQQIQNFTSSSQVNASGVTINPQTGLPIQLTNLSTATANRNQAYRLTTSSINGVLLLNRDTFSAAIIFQDTQNPGGTGAQNLNSSSTYGSLGWQHDASETIQTYATVQYGVQDVKATNATGSSSQPTLYATAGLTKIFSEKLSGTVRYTLVKRDSSDATQRVTINEILLGLQQRF